LLQVSSGRSLSSFKASDVSITRTNKPRKRLPLNELKFGASFTDHWLKIEWNEQQGWGNPVIEPYGKVVLDPSALVFHYALECFEGMKAYKDKSGSVRLFRPEENMRRMNTSAQRLALPSIPEADFLQAIKTLLKVDQEWIPQEKGYSLYIRPTMIATTALLGVSPPKDALLYVILSPVGPYYPTGFKPISLLADTMHVRAWPGGPGGFKIGANYAPTIQPAREASVRGFQQILWLLDDYVTEVGTMNLFCYWTNEVGEKELITAPLDGTILPGVTRSSILDLAKQWNEFKVSERRWTIKELVKALNDKRVFEVFGAGTAAIVAPVSGFEYKGSYYNIPCKDNIAGDLTQRLLSTITSIQYGETQSPWSVVVD
jgi:branched-chain amino acid aminotransferase